MTSAMARGRMIKLPANLRNPFARATSQATGNRLNRINRGGKNLGVPG